MIDTFAGQAYDCSLPWFVSSRISAFARATCTMVLVAWLVACGDRQPMEPVNRAPVAVGSMLAAELAIDEGLALNVTQYFSDPDGDSLTYAASVSDSAIVSVSVTGPVVTILALKAGSATLTVTASDGELSASQEAALTVFQPNRTPVAVGSIPATELAVDQGLALSVALYFSDPDGDSLTYAASVSDSAIVSVSVAGPVVTISALEVGSATLTVTASDGELSASQEAALTVFRTNWSPVAVGSIPATELAIDEELALNVTQYFSDPDGDSLTYAASASDSAIVSVSVAGPVVTISALAVGSATLTVTASDGELSASQEAALTVFRPNRAPDTVGSIPATELAIDEGLALTVNQYFSDPDGDSLTYAASVSDSAIVSVSMAGPVVTISALAVGSATLTVTASDGELSTSQEAALMVFRPNRAPDTVGSIAPKELAIDEGLALTVNQYFSDPDGDSLTYAASVSDSAIASVSVAGPVVTISALEVGSATLTVTASDGELSTSQEAALTVFQPNRSPVAVGSIAARQLAIDEGLALNVALYFSDPDGDSLTYLVSVSDSVIVSASAAGPDITIWGLEVGSATLTVTASDGELSASQEAALTVFQPNRGPVAVGSIAARQLPINEGLALTVAQYFSDPDGDSLTYTASVSDSAIASASVAGPVVTISALEVGSAILTVTASDGELSASQEAVLTVFQPNRAPVAVGSIAARQLAINEGLAFNVAQYFSDPDGDSLTYAASVSDSAIASVSVAGPVVTISAIEVGSTTLTVTASDGDLSASQEAALTVFQTNRAPVAVGSIAARKLVIDEGLALNVAQYFSDPDGDSLTYAASVSDSAIASVSVAGPVVTISALEAGSTTLTVTASDGNLSASQEAALTVVQTNRAPVAVGSIPATELVIDEGLALNVAQYFSDPDGDSLTYAASVSDSAIASASVAGPVVTISALEVGSTTLTVTASDGDLSASQEAALTVRLIRSPIGSVTISPDRPRVFGEGEEVRITAVVRDTTGVVLSGAPVAWSSSALDVATVSTTGLVAAVAEGAATITATSDQVSDSVRIAVGPPPIRLEYEALRTIYEQLGGSSWKASTNWVTDQALDTWSGVSTDASGFVTELRLDENDLVGTLPGEIGALKRLWRLDLDFNFGIIGAIPPEIGDMESLIWLKLSSTGLSGPVPAEIGKLSNLEVLQLHFTNLTTLPPELGNLAELVEFTGYLSKFSGPLPTEIGNLKKVRQMFLNGNSFSGAIPSQIGDMTNLERLHLHDNDFTGSIPPALGRAANLSVLRLSNNRLDGELPGELGSAGQLRWLALDGNRLSGPLPATLGNLGSLETMEVQSNDLSGPIPPEFGSLQQLQEMSAANNPKLTGPLPTEITQLGALQRLLLGGTELCAPTDPQFLAWLRGVGANFVKRCVTAVGSDAYLTQAVQSREYPVPLIAGDSALLRVFVVSEQAADAGVAIPPARATFYRGNSEVYAVDLPGTSTTVPAELDESDLDLSLNAVIPGSVLQPGLEMVVEIDPEETLDPGLGVNVRLPNEGKTLLEVETVPMYELNLIPFLWTEQPDSVLLAKVNGITPDSPLLWATREFLPVHRLNVAHHDPIWMDENPSAGNMQSILRATQAAREAEGGSGHWVGVWSGCCGLAAPSSQAAGVGLEPTGSDHFWQNNNVLAHELGHLMSLPHAPCNVTDPDLNFPYSDGNIGSWGYDMRVGELRAPDSPEVMSYCGERRKWISGYYHSQALAWRRQDSGSRARQVARVRSLMVWGGVQPDGDLQLEPAFVLDAVPTRSVQPGPYTIMGRDDRGRALFSHSLAMDSVDHGGSAFALMIPVDPEWESTLDQIELVGPEGHAQVSLGGATASVLLTDPATGQIRGFLRHGMDIALGASVPSNEMLRALLPEPGLAVHVSRGIPAPSEWRR